MKQTAASRANMKFHIFLHASKTIRAQGCRCMAGCSCRRRTLSSTKTSFSKQRYVIRFLAHGWRLIIKWHCTGDDLNWAAADHHAVPGGMESRHQVLPKPVLQKVGLLVAAVWWQEGRWIGARPGSPWRRPGARRAAAGASGSGILARTLPEASLLLHCPLRPFDTLPGGVSVEMRCSLACAHTAESTEHLACGVQPFGLRHRPMARLWRRLRSSLAALGELAVA